MPGGAKQTEAQGVRFRAFISYSHTDRQAAMRLHRRLETYRLPKYLRAGGAADRRLGAIFRDREDLPAADDLTQSVKTALARSDTLVVLCSPAASLSPWVAREIALFRELHPERPVLAAVLLGEPAEAIPAALRAGREPLAADLRREGDGARLGFLKIVAGIAGVPLDALVQRDAQRRMRRVMAVTAGALVAVLVMVVMTMIALQARNEAQRQQAQAEGLVEYMLTDLRTELKGVGRLDVMGGVNRRAMAYYNAQGDIARLPAESLERRARILHAMGEDDSSLDQLDRAAVRFAEAHRVTAELLARDPGNPDRVYAHAQSEYWLGYVGYAKGDLARAERHWRAYAGHARALVAAEPQRARSWREAGYAEGNLCSLALAAKRDPAQAVVQCEASLERMKRARVLAPASERAAIASDIANRHAWLGGAWEMAGDLDKAMAQFEEQLRILERLTKDAPGNLARQEQLMRGLISIAELAERKGDTRMRDAHISRASALVEQLIKTDGANAKWRGWKRRIDMMGKQAGGDQ